MRPARQLVDAGPLGYEVQYSNGFTTQDPTLAKAVAEMLDREQPLPCVWHDWLEITALGDAHQQWVCGGCSETRRGDRPESQP
jgi:hypothetical protein